MSRPRSHAAPAAVSIGAVVCLGSWLSSGAPSSKPAPITFEDIAGRAGVDFVLRNSATPAKHQIETMAGGVAVFDYDNDGKPDLYFVNGARQPSLDKPDPSYYNRLYRNNGDGTFTDVTLGAGVAGDALPPEWPLAITTTTVGKTCLSPA